MAYDYEAQTTNDGTGIATPLLSSTQPDNLQTVHQWTETGSIHPIHQTVGLIARWWSFCLSQRIIASLGVALVSGWIVENGVLLSLVLEKKRDRTEESLQAVWSNNAILAHVVIIILDA